MSNIRGQFRGVEDKMQSLMVKRSNHNAESDDQLSEPQLSKDVASVSTSYRFEQTKVASQRTDQIVHVNDRARNEHYEPERRFFLF